MIILHDRYGAVRKTNAMDLSRATYTPMYEGSGLESETAQSLNND